MTVMYQVQVPIGSLPINLVLVGNKFRGGVVFVKVAPFRTIIDQAENGQIAAVFTQQDFTLLSDDAADSFEYNTVYEYKDIPVMLRWLQQQKLEQPATIFG